jgi:cytosine/adenosine deaminase-related metal-dependent hydrolase
VSGIRLYSASLVLPVTAPPVLDGAIAVRDGRILHVGDRAWVRSALEDRGADYDETHFDGVLTPGLVNAHTHLQYTGMAEVGTGRYQGFDDWAEAFDASYRRPHDWRADAAAGTRALLKVGCTAAADVVTDAVAVSALHDAGLHGIAYWEVMSWQDTEWHAFGRDQVIGQLGRIPVTPGVGLSPHAPYSLDTVPLHQIPDIVRERGLRLHIHLGESQFEGERMTASEGEPSWRFAGVQSFRALRELGFGDSATEFVDQLGVLGPDCHIAHGVYMTARDRELLRLRGTSVALCPRSNEVIGLEEPPVADYLREGNAIAVGTDSLSSSPSLDPLADVAALHALAVRQRYTGRDLHLRLLAAATLGGARALGHDVGPRRLGQLGVGALADFAVFAIEVATVADALAGLVEAGSGRCTATFVSGVPRWEASYDRI